MSKQFVKGSDEFHCVPAADPSVLVRLLIAGGDLRIQLKPTSNLNCYG
jgi:hypothetical protein